MNITTKPAFNPIVITLENENELNWLSDCLYEIDLERLEEHYQPCVVNFIRDLRIDLYDYKTDK